MSFNDYIASLSSSLRDPLHRYLYLAATIAVVVLTYPLTTTTNDNNKPLSQMTNPSEVPLALHEIGEAMRHMFMTIRALTCEKTVTSVEVVDDDPKYRRISVRRNESHVICSPLVLGTGGEEEWDNMEAVFAYTMCGFSVAWMWDVLKLLVLPRKWRVMEVKGNVHRCPMEARSVYPNHDGPDSRAGDYEHIFWLITLDDDREFALDLSCAQFGYHRTVTPYSEYKTILRFTEKTRQDPGKELERMRGYIHGMSPVDKLGEKITKRLTNMVGGFVQEHGSPVDAKALMADLGHDFLETIVANTIASHPNYVRIGQRILVKNHPATQKEIADAEAEY